jgi:hypothetical protein
MKVIGIFLKSTLEEVGYTERRKPKVKDKRHSSSRGCYKNKTYKNLNELLE